VGNQCPLVNIFVWEESRADHHVLSHSEVYCRPSILTGDCVKAVHACNSTVGLLFANFPLFMLLSTTNLTPASLNFRAYPLLKLYVTLYPIFLSKCTLISFMVVIFMLYSINCHCNASMAPVLCSTCLLSCPFPYAYSEVSSGIMK